MLFLKVNNLVFAHRYRPVAGPMICQNRPGDDPPAAITGYKRAAKVVRNAVFAKFFGLFCNPSAYQFEGVSAVTGLHLQVIQACRQVLQGQLYLLTRRNPA